MRRMNTVLVRVAALAVVAAAPAPRSLFDGKTLKGWTATNFGGEGTVRVERGEIRLGPGDPLTGVTWTGGDIPKTSYEVTLEARRVSGSDFFCALTFPVGADPCTFVVGGWGGTVVGLSSLDLMDASENETSKSMTFTTGRWYRVRVRVTPKRIEAWIDDEKMADVETAGRKISVRPEVEASRPLGIASYRTGAALREIKIRPL